MGSYQAGGTVVLKLTLCSGHAVYVAKTCQNHEPLEEEAERESLCNL